MVNKYDEALEVLFTGEKFKYTLVFNKVKRPYFGTRCNIFEKKMKRKENFVIYHHKTNVSENALSLYMEKFSLSDTVNIYKICIDVEI